MRTKVIMTICLFLLMVGKASAQWSVIDPTNIAQSIINSSNNIVHTSSTAQNMINNFKETVKIYEQGKKYYDALKSVNNLVKDARKVQQTILMVGDITDIYINNYQKMMHDDNFSVEELSAIGFGYTKLLEESNDVLTELKNVVNITTLSMTDKERMDVVERCYSKMKRYRNLVSYYTNKNISVSYLRAKKKNDLDRIMGLYGKSNEKYWLPMDFENLHQILRSLYDEMMPLCSDMTDIAKGLAGLGALFYVALRVWQSLSRAEPIDVFPLLRPFAIGLAIMFFPTIVLGTLNSVMSPIVQGTHSMLETQTFDMNEYRAQKDKLEYEAMKRNPETAYLVSNEEFDKQLDELGWSPGDVVTMAGMYVERGMYSMKKSIRDFFRELLELLFQAAALVIDVLRTFFLIVLSILGPLCFAISVWDGFQSTLTQWFCRYIQIYLWLPVSDLFSTILAKIQVLMLQNDIEALQNDPNFSIEASNGVYIVFLIIGIIGYFTIPTVAGWIIQAGGGIGNYNRNVNTAGSLGGSIAGATAGNVAGRAGRLIKSGFKKI